MKIFHTDNQNTNKIISVGKASLIQFRYAIVKNKIIVTFITNVLMDTDSGFFVA